MGYKQSHARFLMLRREGRDCDVPLHVLREGGVLPLGRRGAPLPGAFRLIQQVGGDEGGFAQKRRACPKSRGSAQKFKTEPKGSFKLGE